MSRHGTSYTLLFALAVLVCRSATAQAPPNPESFRNGVAYTFQRTFATREVHDHYDNGRISLTVYIWRPLGLNRHEVVLFSHGSLGGQVVDPAEPVVYMPDKLREFFVRRGYTVVLATRRGVGASTGTFREECPFSAGRCSLADYRNLTESGLAEAVSDNNAVIDQVIDGKEVPKGSRILMVGISRGGLLSVRMSAERPELTRGVINFVGGWLSVMDTWPPAENEARMQLQRRLFSSMGRAPAPTLWIYAARDPFYSEATTRDFFAQFKEGGGVGDYVFVPEHSLTSGHLIGTEPQWWTREVEAYLDRIGSR